MLLHAAPYKLFIIFLLVEEDFLALLAAGHAILLDRKRFALTACSCRAA
jgi:hypothetical protein